MRSIWYCLKNGYNKGYINYIQEEITMLSKTTRDMLRSTKIDTLSLIGASIFIGLVFMLFVGYFTTTPPVWWTVL